MTHVVTLIGPVGASALTDTRITLAAACVPNPGEFQWLGDGEACDIPFLPAPDTELRVIEQDIRDALGTAPIDVAILPEANRRKKLLVADMDSTIIQQECIDEIADFAGLKPRVAAITEHAMRGELEFESALRERVALLAGLDEAVLARVMEERIELMPGAPTLVRTMQSSGAYCALVSGGFSYFTGRVAAMTGFDSDQANRLDIAKGKLTGRVGEPILGQNAKLEALRSFREARGLDAAETMAVGDGANDLAMIREAGLGVAYRAKPRVAAEARIRIDHGDLTALLYLQGYRRATFAA